MEFKSEGPKQLVSVAELHAWHKPVNIPSLKHCENLTDLLIHIVTQPEYLSKLKDRTSRKKDVWLAVAKKLENLGYPLSTESDFIAAEKCNQKIRNLKKTYHKFLKDSVQGFKDCGKINVPKYLGELPKLFGSNSDDMYRHFGSEITFMETSDVSRLVEPRELVRSVARQKSKKKLPTIIILKPGKERGGNPQSYIYPAASDQLTAEIADESMVEVTVSEDSV